ncbi:MAG TPA: response regulator [Candidatus Acidoferrales bacterium]|nr:response regulator [Candidatus Acidoferrales bacterium]
MATILVADDNSNIQKMVGLALKDQGIDVVAVGNGEAAVRKIPEAVPDLILADTFMPVRNGYEVCEFVKKDARYSHIPVVLLVGAFDPLDEQEAQRVRADGVLKKPFVPPDPLVTMVKALLEKSGRLVPVAATAFAPAAEKTAAAESAAPAEPLPPPFDLAQPEEPLVDVAPANIDFGKSGTPLAFGELLETSAAEPTSEPEPEASGLHDTGLGDMALWSSATATEAPVAETQEDFRVEEPVAEPEDVHSGFPGLAAAESPTTEESEASPTESTSEFELREVFAEHNPHARPEETQVTTSGHTAAGSWDLVSAQASEPAAPAAPAAPARSDAARSFAVPPPPDPQVVEAVVARVVERLQPQVVDIVTREILRPVVEALVRRTLEKI